MFPLALASAQVGSSPASGITPARLLTGPEPARGLEFFPPNALPVLKGTYDLGNIQVEVWSCRVPIVFSKDWLPLPRLEGEDQGFRSLDRPGLPVVALSGPGYTLFFRAPAWDSATRRFATAMEKRFRPFFLNAATDAELSFPAFVDYKP